MILGAAYLLWLYQRTMLGQVTNGKNLTIPDMNFREVAMFVPLIALGHLDRRLSQAVLRHPAASRWQQIVERVRPGYFNGAAAPALAQRRPSSWRKGRRHR